MRRQSLKKKRRISDPTLADKIDGLSEFGDYFFIFPKFYFYNIFIWVYQEYAFTNAGLV